MASSHVAVSPAEWRPWAAPVTITWAEQLLVFAAFIILFGTFDKFLTTVGKPRTEGTLLFQVLSGGVYLSGVLLLLYRGIPIWLLKVLRNSLPLIALTMLAMLSTLWSLEPSPTFRRSVALTLSFFFTIYVVSRFDTRTIFRLLTAGLLLFIALGIAAALFAPGFGTAGGGTYAGAWRGLGGHKNNFGRTVALAVALLPLGAALGLVEWRKFILFLTPVMVAVLLLSRSATALVTAFASIVVGTGLYVALGGKVGRFRLKWGLGLALLVIVAITGFLTVTFGWTAILEALGRDPTLTGRTKLWEWAIALNASHDRWLLGSGYRSFWVDANTKYFFTAFSWGENPETNAGPSHSHSGYVDLIVELGYVGLTVFVVFVISALALIRRTLSRGRFEVGFIFAVILSFLLVYATTAKSILQQSEDLWFLVGLFYLLAEKESFLARRGSSISQTTLAHGLRA